MSDFYVNLDENGVLTIAAHSSTRCGGGFALKQWWEKFSNNIPGATLRILIHSNAAGKDQVFEQSTNKQHE